MIGLFKRHCVNEPGIIIGPVLLPPWVFRDQEIRDNCCLRTLFLTKFIFVNHNVCNFTLLLRENPLTVKSELSVIKVKAIPSTPPITLNR